jgi:ATP-dependent Lhr-like helicase
VQGFAGEHFALPEAVSLLRDVRKQPHDEQLITISSADPLNLTGIITPGKRIAAQAGHRILYKDGKPIATNQSGEVKIDENIPANEHWHIKSLLTRRPHPAAFHKPPQGPLV